MLFRRLRMAILVHGCFWHHHGDPACRNAVLPKTRADWWRAKVLANVERDGRNLRQLQGLGWDVLVLWECKIRGNRFNAKLASFLGAPAPAPEAHFNPARRRSSRSAAR
jgi:DNA mismatch endonuclease (patch repair protein)